MPLVLKCGQVVLRGGGGGGGIEAYSIESMVCTTFRTTLWRPDRWRWAFPCWPFSFPSSSSALFSESLRTYGQPTTCQRKRLRRRSLRRKASHHRPRTRVFRGFVEVHSVSCSVYLRQTGAQMVLKASGSVACTNKRLP